MNTMIPPLRVGILTISDRSARGDRPDLSGPALAQAIVHHGWRVVQQGVVPDEFEQIKKTMTRWANSGTLDLLLTTGGTGFSRRDITPEVTLEVVEKLAPGLVEAARAAGFQRFPHAMLSRGMAGIRGTTLIVNLPGSPKGALEHLEVMAPALPHAIQLLRADPDAESSHGSVGA